MKIREYEIIEKIGQPGGMAVVYKAKHQSLEVIRAIKKLHFHLATNSTLIQRFENEARALSILEHPNIVKVYDFFMEEESYYLIMEYVDGSSLAEILKESALSEKVALNYLKQILSTIGFAHSKKILHRDIKPSNILINSQNIVKVVDFGIAKMMDRKGLTSTGLTMGSPWYMSPEQIVGQDLDERSDIYSLGITLFEMLTGQVPFNDTSEYKIYEMHRKKPIPTLKEIDKKFSPDLDTIIKKATAKNQKDRYQNAEQFAEAIDIYIALSEFSGKAGATIAEFDPTEYMNIKKTKAESTIDIDLPTTIKPVSPVEEKEKPPQKTSVKETQVELTKEKEKNKRTSFQQATVFQDVSGKQPHAGVTSDLIDQKEIAGLEKTKKLFLPKNIIYAAGGVGLILILVLIIIFSGKSTDVLTIKQGNVSYQNVQLIWPEVKNAESYEISKKSINASAFQLINTIQNTIFTDSTLNPGEECQYQINAKKKDGGILVAGKITAKTPSINFGLSVDNIASKEAAISWNQIENSQSYILFRRDNDPASSDKLTEIYRGNEHDYTDKRLKSNQSYSYLLKVKFRNNKEYGSAIMDVKTEVSLKIPPPLAFGELRVNSTPSGAKVYLDGMELGSTPFTRKGLTAGSYKIKIKKQGYSDFSQTVRIRSNRATRLSPTLSSSTGNLAVRVKPYGSIYVDGKLYKKDSPVQFTTELSAGSHKVSIVHTGLAARWEKYININGGTTEKLLIDFTKIVNVMITSKPWATIVVDGKSTGQITPKQIKLRVGLHSIGIFREGYEMVGGSKIINFEYDIKEPFTFNLRQK